MRHVVIVGGGFGGLCAAQALKDEPVYVTVIDRSNHHTFQPLLYQVAMAGLSPAEVAMPIRSILSRQKNVRVLLGEVKNIDVDSHSIQLRDGEKLDYDFLVVAAGAQTSYFGNDEWSKHALGLKDLDDALEIRQRVLLAFEAAERECDERTRARLQTFVVVGGGPTGVELAGSLAELSRNVLARDFRRVQPASTRILLLEGGPRLLPSFDPALSESAKRQLTELGVEVRTNTMTTRIDEQGVHLGDKILSAGTVLWAAGVKASPLAVQLGGELDRQGRVVVGQDCSLPNHPEVFIVGDMASFTEPGAARALPGVAPVAVQMGRSVGANIARALHGVPRVPFKYVNKGSMATIGRSRAIAERGSMKVSGFLAWASWLFVHVLYLLGVRNRMSVLMNWAWSYFTYGSSSRIITRRALRQPAPELASVMVHASSQAPVSGHAPIVVPPAANASQPQLPVVAVPVANDATSAKAPVVATPLAAVKLQRPTETTAPTVPAVNLDANPLLGEKRRPGTSSLFLKAIKAEPGRVVGIGEDDNMPTAVFHVKKEVAAAAKTLMAGTKPTPSAPVPAVSPVHVPMQARSLNATPVLPKAPSSKDFPTSLRPHHGISAERPTGMSQSLRPVPQTVGAARPLSMFPVHSTELHAARSPLVTDVGMTLKRPLTSIVEEELSEGPPTMADFGENAHTVQMRTGSLK